ncbi:hypothetical protein I6A84_37375 [Frankia sp. CNm7]|uniref:HAF repeat-containing protein n=1 Tax=Frankia nepalensis TaxID=1836974 RepID=A0A937UMC0_9ACTN|nr:hypothetical protein [Frankia nepalensis]MBL7496838.1 hypothetical protein [Frankia nepalensis]MBL7510951.1 hypothetical protein [Frankia nepalensis]MBL7523571.1 hypothetical protein [Frankia nepalensis]MBL7626908.1 hypothetical protein [Frankia nepalensis]
MRSARPPWTRRRAAVLVLLAGLVGPLAVGGCADLPPKPGPGPGEGGGTGGAATAIDASGDGDGPVTVAGLSDDGDVAGYRVEGGRGFLFADGTVHELPPVAGSPSGTPVMVAAVNAGGQVAGAVPAEQGRYQPVVWPGPGAPAIPVGPTASGTSKDLNDRGDVLIDDGTTVVVATAAAGPVTAASGIVVRVPALPGATKQYGQAINNEGLVIGWAEYGGAGRPSAARSYLWDGARLTDLGSLDPRPDTAAFVRPAALNERGQVVGSSLTPSGDTHAFLWEDGRMTDLGTLGGRSSFATDVNEHGQVVGYSATATEEVHAFFWDQGTMIDLGVLAGDHSEAGAINDAGQIAGFSTAATSPTTTIGATNPTGGEPSPPGTPAATTTHAVVWKATRALTSPVPGGGDPPPAWGVELTDLGVPPGFDASAASALNSRGDVAGTATAGDRDAHAFVWAVGRR